MIVEKQIFVTMVDYDCDLNMLLSLDLTKGWGSLGMDIFLGGKEDSMLPIFVGAYWSNIISELMELPKHD